MAFYQRKNNAKSQINMAGGLLAGGLALTVDDGSQFPAVGNFLITIWDKANKPDPTDDSGMEIVLCTARVGNILTITRAQESTTDIDHRDNSAVEMLITAGTFTNLENNLLAIDGSNANTTINIGSQNLTTTGTGTIGHLFVTDVYSNLVSNEDVGNDLGTTSLRWAQIYGGNVHTYSDSHYLYQGAADDVRMNYNGTNWVFNSRVVGTGNYLFQGGWLRIGGLATATPSQAIDIQSGALGFDFLSNPGSPTATVVPAGTGLLSAGAYYYRIDYVNAIGQTASTNTSTVATIVNPAVEQIEVSSIGVSTDPTVTSRRIWRTKAGGSIYYFVVEIADNVTTTYTDNIADASLTIVKPIVATNAAAIYVGTTKAVQFSSSGDMGLGAFPATTVGNSVKARLHFQDAIVTGLTSDSYDTFLMEATDCRMELASSSAGNNGSAIIWSATDATPTKYCWTMMQGGVSQGYKWFLGYTEGSPESTSIATYADMTMDLTGQWGLGTTTPDRHGHIEDSTALTNTVTYPFRLAHITSGTPAANIGLGIEFEQELASGGNHIIGAIENVMDDMTATAEDSAFVFKTMKAGAAVAETARLDSLGTWKTDSIILNTYYITVGTNKTIQSVITSITPTAANPYVVVVSPGTFTENLTLKDNMELRGQGDGKTVLNGTITIGDGGASTYTNVTVRDMQINGAVILNKASYIKVMNCTIDANNNNYGINIGGISSFLEVTNCNIKNAEIHNIYIFGLSGNGFKFTNCNISLAVQSGIYMDGNLAEPLSSPEGTLITGCYLFQNSYYGIYVKGIHDPQILNNKFEGNLRGGVYVYVPIECMISSNTFEVNYSTHALSESAITLNLDATAGYGVGFGMCNIINNILNTEDRMIYILGTSNSEYIVDIIGNTICYDAQANGMIEINGRQSSHNINISGNQIRSGNTGIKIYDVSQKNGAKIVINNNQIWGLITGINIDYVTSVEISNNQIHANTTGINLTNTSLYTIIKYNQYADNTNNVVKDAGSGYYTQQMSSSTGHWSLNSDPSTVLLIRAASSGTTSAGFLFERTDASKFLNFWTGSSGAVIGFTSDAARLAIGSYTYANRESTGFPATEGISILPTGEVGINGATAPEGALEINASTTFGEQLVTLDQNDADQAFFDYQGTSAADQANNISTVQGDGIVSGPQLKVASAGWVYAGMVKVEINGVAKWMPYYDTQP